MISDIEFDQLCWDYETGVITLDAFVQRAYLNDAQRAKVKKHCQNELNTFASQKPLRLVERRKG